MGHSWGVGVDAVAHRPGGKSHHAAKLTTAENPYHGAGKNRRYPGHLEFTFLEHEFVLYDLSGAFNSVLAQGIAVRWALRAKNSDC